MDPEPHPQQKETETEKPPQTQTQPEQAPPKLAQLWDCGSTLYDSFELRSLKNTLDSAIATRTFSMPHFPDHRHHPQPPPPASSKRGSKISRSLHKLLRSVFKPKVSAVFGGPRQDQDMYFYDNSGTLSTIPEVPESEYFALSPDASSSVIRRRTASERFAPASVGISCA